MSKTITIKLTKTGPNAGPFTLTDVWGNTIASNLSLEQVKAGISFIVDDNVDAVTIKSEGSKCTFQKTFPVGTITEYEYQNTPLQQLQTGCVWRHLNNHTIYNSFYGVTSPYIIEYPFNYQYQDEIVQFVKDYSKVFKYFLDPYGVSNNVSKIELDDAWFNKAVLYNGQQSTGVLVLVPKPVNNLKSYMQYPIFNSDSKTITYTKADNFYNYNTFWSIVKDKTQPLFVRTCDSLSLDKVVNQINMDYGTRSFKKDPLRAKELKVRHILDDRSDIHIVSQFILTPAQISYR
jgi:hypothetical protein